MKAWGWGGGGVDKQEERAQVKGSAPSEAIGKCNSNGRCKDKVSFPSYTTQKPAERVSACGVGEYG